MSRPVPWPRIVLPSFIALPILAVLLGLGSWQLQRLQWKLSILSELQAAAARPPVEPAADTPPFARIAATGRFRPGAEAMLGLEVRGTVLGAGLIAVLDRPGAAPLLVDRGWAPLEGGHVERPEGEVAVSGYARPTEHNPLAAADDPARRRFYTFDARAIALALGAPDALPYALTVVVPRAVAAAPTGLGSTPAPSRGPLPEPAAAFPEPANSHLGYAITWFALAAAWVAIFVLWSRKRLSET
ncbi:SURF1 family protein [Roseococcus sp. SYP-B2431]|uniref:SURF1 family protein n=1 Tax=Roseococcus sp. SYP-B2431 TaxID=2496640 RepID=UPI00103864B0|nr:SURF1 family protein [Roseococcus sp. SYP-B2431]TCH96779.1 SURF1 family protein [Roseococcus sp. SYP-B2431]